MGKASTDSQNGDDEVEQKRKKDEQNQAGPPTLSSIAIMSFAFGVMTALCSDARTRCNSIIPKPASISRYFHWYLMIPE
jgi:hypothetical protein